jgi:hypothetical protein
MHEHGMKRRILFRGPFARVVRRSVDRGKHCGALRGRQRGVRRELL